MQNPNYSFSVMFSEAQNQLARQFSGSAVLRDHAKTIIGVSSVVVSFFATFKVFDNVTINSNLFLIILFLLIGCTYGLLMVLAIIAASPIALEAPINPSIRDYTEAYADQDEKTILSNQVVLYLRAIEKNNKIIWWQRILSFSIDIMLAIMVILIITSAILSVLL